MVQTQKAQLSVLQDQQLGYNFNPIKSTNDPVPSFASQQHQLCVVIVHQWQNFLQFCCKTIIFRELAQLYR